MGLYIEDIVMDILAIICYLVVAAVCALIAEKFVPGSVPGGFLTAAIVGVIGAWVGGNLVGHLGPDLAGISLIPCILGSALLVFCFSFAGRRFRGSRV
jgi:uncharacterized membrane protein YeaQ/YmgE (transglycosylase-associated protein family)